MSLGIAFKVPEGIVLAADSRVTLFGQTSVRDQPLLIPAKFDHATKLLRIKTDAHQFVGAITFGAGAIGQRQPRTANSFLPEFERVVGQERLSVDEFARRLGTFFVEKWNEGGMPENPSPNESMFFFVGGYNTDEAYGHLYQLMVPGAPEPVEILPDTFGALWGGQREITDRIIQGFDPKVPAVAQDLLGIAPGDHRETLGAELKERLQLPIPWQFLPLQDCVNLAIFLVRATITLQQFLVDVRGVGGAVDVAAITRTGGFDAIQVKEITGERPRG